MAKHLVSPIVYMGSKRRLMEQLMDIMPQDADVFYDVFGGSGTVALNVPAQKVLLNEFDTTLHLLHRYFTETPFYQIQDDMQSYAKKYGDGKRLTRIQYEELRDEYNTVTDKDIRQMHLLLHFAFQKMLRFNGSGGFNTSFNNRVKSLPRNDYYAKLYTFSEVLQGKQVELTNLDFRELDYTLLGTGDFVYFDPPYLMTQAMYNGGWSEEDDAALYQLINELSERGVRFGLSNVMTHKGKVNQQLKDFSSKYHVKHLNITYDTYLGDKEVAEVADEVYVTNYLP